MFGPKVGGCGGSVVRPPHMDTISVKSLCYANKNECLLVAGANPHLPHSSSKCVSLSAGGSSEKLQSGQRGGQKLQDVGTERMDKCPWAWPYPVHCKTKLLAVKAKWGFRVLSCDYFLHCTIP